jgi:hypothetical protein
MLGNFHWLPLVAEGIRGYNHSAGRVHRYLRPPWRIGGIVYQATSSQTASRRDDRRRNPRLKAPSIIYAQLGSDNGGIVVNLGLNGVSCHAAQQLTVKKNSTLNLRLRGSGLNAEVVGEIIWLGATQREVGIRFKNLSTGEQNDIADWIGRHTEGSEPSPLQDRSQLKPMPAMPGIAVTGQKLAPHSLSAALAMAKAIPVDSASSANAGAVEPSLPASLNSVARVSVATPMPPFVAPAQQSIVPADKLDSHVEAQNADSLASQVQRRPQQPFRYRPVPEASPIEHPVSSQAPDSPAKVSSEKQTLTVRKEPAQTSAESPGKTALSNFEKNVLILWDRIFRRTDRLLESEAAGRWIPPALLGAWRRGNHQQKLLLAGKVAACFGIFALTLTLAIAQVESSLGRPEKGGSPQQSTAPPVASIVTVGSTTPAGPIQAPLAMPAPHPSLPAPPPPPPTLLEGIENSLSGKQPDPAPPPEINGDQVRVTVWVSKSNGYYYCTDDAFYKSVQPGTFTSQGNALQSGYRSILGQFCN